MSHLATYSPSFQPFPLHLALETASQAACPLPNNGSSHGGADDASSTTTTTVTAFGTAMKSTSTPTTDIGKLSYFLKCCVLGCGMPCRNNVNNNGQVISFDLFDYVNADQQRLSITQQELIYKLVTKGDFMLEKVLKNHYIIIDEQHKVLPKQSNNIFINVPPNDVPQDSKEDNTSRRMHSSSISSTLMEMSSYLHPTNDNDAGSSSSQLQSSSTRDSSSSSSSSGSGGLGLSNGRRQVMLCTNAWINEYYLNPIIGYMYQRRQRCQQRLRTRQSCQQRTNRRNLVNNNITSSSTGSNQEAIAVMDSSSQQQSPVQRESNHSHNMVFLPFHSNIQCDECMIQGIRGSRYRCTTLDNYDLCEFCYYNGNYDITQGTTLMFERIEYPGASPEILGSRNQDTGEDVAAQKTKKKRSCDDMLLQQTTHYDDQGSYDEENIPLVEAVPLQRVVVSTTAAGSTVSANNCNIGDSNNANKTKKRRKLSYQHQDTSIVNDADGSARSSSTHNDDDSYNNNKIIKEDSASWFLPGQLVRLVNLPKSCEVVDNCLGTVHERHVNGSIVVRVKKELDEKQHGKKNKNKATKETYAILQLLVKAENLVIVVV